MKTRFLLFALIFSFLKISFSQITIDSYTVQSRSYIDCETLIDYYTLYPTDTCNRYGSIELNISNNTSDYLTSVNYFNNGSYLPLESKYDSSSVANASGCLDTLQVIVFDTLSSTSDTVYIYPDTITCVMDTFYRYARVNVAACNILLPDSLYYYTDVNNVTRQDTVNTGVFNIVPTGGHVDGYRYRIDTIISTYNGSFPPSQGTQGIAPYTYSDTTYITNLAARWHGIFIQDTTKIDTLIIIYDNPECSYCVSRCTFGSSFNAACNSSGKTYAVVDTAQDPGIDSLLAKCFGDTSANFWIRVPVVSDESKGGPVKCGNSLFSDCNPYTTNGVSSSIFGGMPPFTVNIFNNTTSTVVQSINQFSPNVYTGTYHYFNIPDDCDIYTITIEDSLNFVTCSYTTPSPVEEAIISNLNIQESRLNSCCDGSISFRLTSTFDCGGLNNYTLTNGVNVISSGSANNGETVLITDLCAGSYYLTDATGCFNDYFIYVPMNDRPCDSSQHSSIDELADENLLSVYPNPALNTVTLEFKDSYSLTNIKYEVYNAIGSKVLDGQINELKSELDLTPLTKGTYSLVITSNQKNIHRKIIKK